MNTNPSTPTQPSSTNRQSHRLWWPTTVALLAAITLVVVWRRGELERMFKIWLTFGVVLLGCVITAIWWLFFSRFSWKARLLALVTLGLAGFGFVKTLRVDGTVDGSGLPRLAWKWSPPPSTQSWAAPAQSPVAPLPPKSAIAQIPDVPQFFGPARDGKLPDVGLSTDWTASAPKELWRQPIGLGWSAFAVANGRAYTQEQRGENELVSCYGLLTGQLLWARTNQVRFSQWQGGDGPRATPTVIGSNLVAYGATGLLDCLKADSGERIWSRDVLGEHHLPNLTWGVSCSPLVYNDTVVVSGGMTNGPTLLAYRLASGEPLWTAGHDKASYASPMLARLAGRDVVLSVNAGSFTAHDSANGKELFNYAWPGEFPKASQPVLLDGNRVFISAGYGVGCVLLQIEAGADGSLTARPIWKNPLMKTLFSSAIAREGYLYGLDDGLVACLDLATGKRQWKDGRYGSGQTLLVGDLLLVQSEPGPVALVEANPAGFKELARWPALSSKTWTFPTLAGRYLLVRNDQEAACYELPLRSGSKSL